ncbi:MAG TPA: ketoacyl-ACP synthase III [Polyangiales bacterium]|nr:ketoacyl-ACP synthase III [Polyangiales bacterium]
MSVYLHGIGHSHPPTEITNQFLEDLDIGTTDAWILERVGIRSRRTVLALDYIKHTKNADPRASVEARTCDQGELGARAAELALARSGISASDIGMVIGGSSAPDFVTPAQACVVAARLGIDAPAFDVASACTSFFVPLHLLSMMAAEQTPRFILLVVPETLTCTVDYRDRSAAVLWGDAAGAAVISMRERGRAELLSASLGSSPASFDKVTVPRQGFFRQEGQIVQKFAIKRMTAMVQALQEAHRTPGRPLSFVGHQANLRMLQSVAAACDIPSTRHFHNVCEYGNTAAAGSVSVISSRWDAWNSEDDVAVAGVGAGLTWASYLLRFMS